MTDEGTNLLEGEPPNRGGEQDAGKQLRHSRAEAPSQAFPAAHPPGQVPREPARVPTLLFLKLTRNGLVRLSAVSSRPRGLLRLAPTSCCPWRISCWAGARPGPARSYSGLPLSQRCGWRQGASAAPCSGPMVTPHP